MTVSVAEKTGKRHRTVKAAEPHVEEQLELADGVILHGHTHKIAWKLCLASFSGTEPAAAIV